MSRFCKISAFLLVLITTISCNQTINKTMTNNTQNAINTNPKMPVLFVGHGSPMNAIEENEFVEGFRKISSEIPKPAAILCISAHWETKGTFVTAMEKPKTIHDFGGFPPALYEVQYPAPGSSSLAQIVIELVKSANVQPDLDWGLDHGTWSVVKHLYPNADVPVVQLSLDYQKTPKQHYELGKELSALREKGILIIGSGNMVHNLGMVAWDKLDADFGYDWALEANQKMVQCILDDNHEPLINYKKQGRAFDLAIPTPEHFWPLLYILGLKTQEDSVKIFNNKPVGGSLTMTSVKIG